MLHDAHNHLQDDRLDPWRPAVMAELSRCDLGEAVVNGSSEEDWSAVAELARHYPWVRPSYGLHPWYVKERTSHWKDHLLGWLHGCSGAAVGEIGLDRWIENPDIEAQVECFRWQMDLAHDLERPATVHCLRAWGLLEEQLRIVKIPERGFLLHSYGGPVEMIPGFAKRGAYFSLSPYFGHPRKAAQLEVFKAVPLERLLAETDAPDMWPPAELNPHPLGSPAKPLNHPANLRVSYELLAKVKEMPVDELIGQIAANYQRLFGDSQRV
ncbi:TatD DNase family protein [Prosthecobacter debontii]|uniref:TatD DNase family protein n=1 Tax=Prosthecobacter debontii TaxID=48467 RepID=A0A1T4WTX3_9BACT|nr:TatD family hydrolase [Prosthecobacter debontii]SKA80308.1 TatD DNase family protein [Prosthecobacter debontii]